MDHGTYRSMQSVVEWMDRTDHPDLISKASELLALRAPSVQLHAVAAAYVLHKRALRRRAGADGTGEAEKRIQHAFPCAVSHERWTTAHLGCGYISPLPFDYFDPNARVALPCRAYVKAYAAHVPNPFSGMDLSECSSVGAKHSATCLKSKQAEAVNRRYKRWFLWLDVLGGVLSINLAFAAAAALRFEDLSVQNPTYYNYYVQLIVFFNLLWLLLRLLRGEGEWQQKTQGYAAR